jgi:hypothetical protein
LNRSGVIKGEGISALIGKVFGSPKIILAVVVGVLLIAVSAFGSDGAKAEGDEVEERIEAMCSSLVGVGECRVMVTYSTEGTRYGASTQSRVESVAVVCRGADRASVRAEITSMISALFGIGSNRIFISKMK